METHYPRLRPTCLRTVLPSMAEKCLIDQLQDGTVDVSDDTVCQASKQLVESILQDGFKLLINAALHTALQNTAETNHISGRFPQ